MSFIAPKWLRNAHLQTIWPHVFRRNKPLSMNEERLELDDGDFIDLFSVQPSGKPVAQVCLFHGLEGSVHSSYMNGMMVSLLQNGYGVFALHFRSTNGVPNRLARAYHSGDTGDIRYVLTLIAKRFPNLPLGAMGVSLGANALLVYLGEEQQNTPVSFAAAVSAPIDLADCTRRISQGFSFIYERKFIQNLRQTVRVKRHLLEPLGIDVARALKASHFYEFDDAITAPLHGFSGAADYYYQASACRVLHQITTPTLMLQSKDDPLLGAACMPDAQDVSSAIEIETTDRGGHVGFVYGKPWAPQFYIEERVLSFFRKSIA